MCRSHAKGSHGRRLSASLAGASLLVAMRSRRMLRLVILAGLLLGLSAVYGIAIVPHANRSSRAPQTLGKGFYIWQRAWSEPLGKAVKMAASQADEFMVLAAELGDEVIAPDWGLLAETAVPTTLVIRIPASFAPRIAADPDDERAVANVAGTIRDVWAHAERHGVGVAGVQIDYDCATSKLGQYRRFINALQKEVPNARWSITALPTWLQDNSFSDLASCVSYFVLQVHSLDKPTTADAPITLCDTSKIDGCLDAAEATGMPFYVALPTYGYQVAFDENGLFCSLAAEGSARAWQNDHTVREVIADPKAMAGVVRKLNKNRPEHCIGIVWFRLPVETDSLNWSWPTLQAVLDGRAPTIAYHAEARAPEPGLVEVWLANTGEDNTRTAISVDVHTSSVEVLAYDTVNNFAVARISENGVAKLQGPAPRDSAPIMIAWYRMSNEHEACAVQIGPVEVK